MLTNNIFELLVIEFSQYQSGLPINYYDAYKLA